MVLERKMEMGGRTWKGKMVHGLAAVAILGLLSVPMISVPAFAQPNGKGNGPNSSDGGGSTKKGALLVKAELIPDCSGCQTDVDGKYSLLPDGKGPYEPAPDVQSEILTHNTVYTLDTLSTLVDGQVDMDTTRTAHMHFYSSVANLPPACWMSVDQNDITNDRFNQNQAVNWSIFSDNATTFLDMAADGITEYDGFARLDFNVRNQDCDREMNRFYLKWTLPNRKTGLGGGGIKIVRMPGGSQWVVQTDEYGETSLYGQGGRGQTEYFGDFRMPFKIILTLVQQ